MSVNDWRRLQAQKETRRNLVVPEILLNDDILLAVDFQKVSLFDRGADRHPDCHRDCDPGNVCVPVSPLTDGSESEMDSGLSLSSDATICHRIAVSQSVVEHDELAFALNRHR